MKNSNMRDTKIYKRISILLNRFSEKIGSTLRQAMSLLDDLAQLVASLEYTKYGQTEKHPYQKLQRTKPVAGYFKSMLNGKRIYT